MNLGERQPMSRTIVALLAVLVGALMLMEAALEKSASSSQTGNPGYVLTGCAGSLAWCEQQER